MIHFPRHGSIKIPFNVALFDASGQPRLDEEETTVCMICCQANGYFLNRIGNYFEVAPPEPTHLVTAKLTGPFLGVYQCAFDVSSWPRGIYIANFTAENKGGGEYPELYQQEFSVGLMVDRRLGYSAAYNGSLLTMSLWVEENGVAQTDYIALDDCRLLNAAGVQLANLGNKTSPTNGVFQITAAVNLAATTNFIFDCVAVCHGPEDTPNYRFPLRVGLARP